MGHRRTPAAAALLACASAALVTFTVLADPAAAQPVIKITELGGDFERNERPQETYSMSDGRLVWMDEINQRWFSDGSGPPEPFGPQLVSPVISGLNVFGGRFGPATSIERLPITPDGQVLDEIVMTPRGFVFDRIAAHGETAAWHGGEPPPTPGGPTTYGVYFYDGTQTRRIGDSDLFYWRSIDITEDKIVFVTPQGKDTVAYDIPTGTSRLLGFRTQVVAVSGDHLLYFHPDSGLNLYNIVTTDTRKLGDGPGSGYLDIDGNFAAWTAPGGIALYDIAAGTTTTVAEPGAVDPRLSGPYLSWQLEGDLFLTTIPEPALAPLAVIIAACWAGRRPVRRTTRRQP